MSLDEAKEDDERLNIDGIEILLGKRDSTYVGDFEIDYVDDYRGKGLIIQSAGAC